MKLSKYYTPELEEFHVGFEYEVKTWKDKWESEKLIDLNSQDSDGALYPWIPTELSLSSFRVKYLDQEDIESLGFIITKDNEEIELSLESKRYIGGPSACDDYKIIILYGLDNKEMWIYKKCNNGYEYDLFKGFIKNKSELKKLLKQLNINDAFK